MKARGRSECRWLRIGDGVYRNCEKGFEFTDGTGPQENSFRFCPHCGERIAEIMYRKETNMNSLNRLHELLDEFEFEDQLSVRNYFIGVLSARVSDDDWDWCLQSARTCAEESHAKRAVLNTITKGDQSNVGSQQQ